MKVVKWGLFGLFVLGGVLVGTAYLLPRQGTCERSVVINAPRETVFVLVNDLREWERWTPWDKETDPTMELTYGTQTVGKGAEYSWKGEKFGTGRLEITASEPASGIAFDLAFGNSPQVNRGALKLATVDGGTRVTWLFVGDMGNNPLNRYMGLMMDSFLGGDFDKGLARLKETAETRARTPPAEADASSENP